MLCQLGRDRGELFEVVERRPAALEIARAEAGGDELLEQRRLAAGRGPKRAQVPRVEAVPCETAAGGGDLDVAFAVEALAQGKTGVMVGETRGELVAVPLEESWTRKKDLDAFLLRLIPVLAR